MKTLSRRRSFAALIGAPVLAALPATLSAKPDSIAGQLIDLGCFEAGRPAKEYSGVHARACALEGFPAAVLTSEGKPYQITGSFAANSNAKLLPYYLAPSVTVTGEVSEKDGKSMVAATDVKAPKQEEPRGRRS